MKRRGNSQDSIHTGTTDVAREVKVVTVGETAVGKSSITLRFVHNHFKENNVATIGASFLSKSIFAKGWVKFNIWDTAGQEKYRSLASLYYRGVDCAILVYDITNRASFEAVQNYWVHELRHQCSEYGGLVLVIAGNKSDLTDKRQVSEQEGRDLAQEYSALFFETSAKKDENVTELFAALADAIPESAGRSVSTASGGSVYKVHVPERNTSCCS
eukprot:gene12340-8826_t